MLSRTADHLYWMARYTERAENTARMLDVNYQMSLMPQSDKATERAWRAMLDISELTLAVRGRMHARYADRSRLSSGKRSPGPGSTRSG